MKKYILATVFLLTFSFTGLSQNFYELDFDRPAFSIEASTLITRSIHGKKMGMNITANLNNRWHISYFSLKSIENSEFTPSTFKGGRLEYMVNPKSRLMFGAAVSVGYYDKQFLSVLPSLAVRYELNELFFVGGGYAHSDGFPHFDLELGLRIFSK